VSEGAGILVVMSRPTRSSNTLIGLVAVVLAAVSLTGCGPSYPDGPKKDAFVNGVEAFCGEGNYVIEDGSNRPLGGPTGIALGAYCIERPTDSAGLEARLKLAFPEGEVTEFEDSVFEVYGLPHFPEDPLERIRMKDYGDPERGYEGPRFTTGYRLNDAS